MKIRLYILSLFLLCVPILGFSQTKATATISVSVTIMRGNSVNQAKSPELTNGVTFLAVKPDQKEAGSFSITGQPGGQVLLSMPDSLNLTDKSGHHVVYTSEMPIYSNHANEMTFKSFQNKAGGLVNFDKKNGKLFVRMGGKPQKHIVSNGNYIGTYTIDIEYLN